MPCSRLPCSSNGQLAVRASPRAARRCRCPRSRPCRRRTGPSGSRRGTSRTRAGGPRRGRRAPWRPGSSGTPFGTAHEASAPFALEPEVVVQPARVVALHDEDRLLAALRSPPNGSGVVFGSRLRLVEYSLSDTLRSFARAAASSSSQRCCLLLRRCALLLRRRDRLAERLHQVDDLAALSCCGSGSGSPSAFFSSRSSSSLRYGRGSAPGPTWRRGSRSASSPSRPRPRAPAAPAPPRAAAPRRRSTSSRARASSPTGRTQERCCLLRITTFAIATRPVSSSALTSSR